MNILFIHRGFPGQFKYIIQLFAQNPQNTVYFITTKDSPELAGVKKFVYKISARDLGNCSPVLKDYEEAILHGQAAAKTARQMKKEGFKPDIIYGHTWGSTLFIKDIFPDVPFLCYFEWFENAQGAVAGFDGKIPDEKKRINIRCHNSRMYNDLCSCDAGISPTHWQKQQFPKEFHDKIKVIHDGIDSQTCKPDSQAKFIIKDKNLELSSKDEVITYATRGMEPMRGFPQFMEAVDKILKKRPKAHIVIGGLDQTFYLDPLPGNKTYKKLMLDKFKLDLNRVHFVGELEFSDYIKLLQISSAHIYLTYPFVLSWSILEAMSTGCCIVASNTPPVLEVIKDNYNGLLIDFFDVEGLVEKIEYALDNKDKMQEIRNNARQNVLDKYEARKMMEQQYNYIISLIQNKGQ